jgi:hypothetical protein
MPLTGKVSRLAILPKTGQQQMPAGAVTWSLDLAASTDDVRCGSTRSQFG